MASLETHGDLIEGSSLVLLRVLSEDLSDEQTGKRSMIDTEIESHCLAICIVI